MGIRLQDKKALITGGASGIARATALLFAQEGADVCVADRNLPHAEQVAAEIRGLGRKAIAHQVDVSEETQVEAMVARAVREFGHIDIVLCAAGVSHATYGLPGEQFEFRPFTEKPLAEWHKVISINLDGVFLTCRAAARDDQGRPRRPHHQHFLDCRVLQPRSFGIFGQQGGRAQPDSRPGG
jgi:glucose 1-dehydrogenase